MADGPCEDVESSIGRSLPAGLSTSGRRDLFGLGSRVTCWAVPTLHQACRLRHQEARAIFLLHRQMLPRYLPLLQFAQSSHRWAYSLYLDVILSTPSKSRIIHSTVHPIGWTDCYSSSIHDIPKFSRIKIESIAVITVASPHGWLRLGVLYFLLWTNQPSHSHIS